MLCLLIHYPILIPMRFKDCVNCNFEMVFSWHGRNSHAFPAGIYGHYMYFLMPNQMSKPKLFALDLIENTQIIENTL